MLETRDRRCPVRGLSYLTNPCALGPKQVMVYTADSERRLYDTMSGMKSYVGENAE